MNHSSMLSPVRHCSLDRPTSGTSDLQRLSDFHHSLSSPTILSKVGSPPSSPNKPTNAQQQQQGLKTLSKAFLQETQEVDKKNNKDRTTRNKKTAAVKDYVLSNLGRVLNLQRNNSGSSYESLSGGGLFQRSYQSGCGVSSLGSSCKDLLDCDTDTDDDLCSSSGRFPLERHELFDDNYDAGCGEDSEIDSLHDPLLVPIIQDHIQVPHRPTTSINKPPRPAATASRRIPTTSLEPKPIVLGSRNSSMPDLHAIQFDSIQSLPAFDDDEGVDQQEAEPTQVLQVDQALSASYPPSYHPKWIPAANQKKTKNDRWMNLDGKSDFIPFSPRRYSCSDATKFTKAPGAGAVEGCHLPSIPRFHLTTRTATSTPTAGTNEAVATTSPTSTANTTTTSTTAGTSSTVVSGGGLAGLQLTPLIVVDTPPIAPRRASDSIVDCFPNTEKSTLLFPRRASLSDTLPTLPRRPLDD